MRDYNLRFHRDRWPDEVFDLELVEEKWPYRKSHGCYVLGASDGTQFVYPWGTSPVFYIGMSKQIRGRLKAHLRWINRAHTEHQSRHFLPLHQYGASFGATAAVYRKVTNQSIARFESKLMTDFYGIYGAIPVANGAWPKQMKQPLGVVLD